jgi:hypothetical protein
MCGLMINSMSSIHLQIFMAVTHEAGKLDLFLVLPRAVSIDLGPLLSEMIDDPSLSNLAP